MRPLRICAGRNTQETKWSTTEYTGSTALRSILLLYFFILYIINRLPPLITAYAHKQIAIRPWAPTAPICTATVAQHLERIHIWRYCFALFLCPVTEYPVFLLYIVYVLRNTIEHRDMCVSAGGAPACWHSVSIASWVQIAKSWYQDTGAGNLHYWDSDFELWAISVLSSVRGSWRWAWFAMFVETTVTLVAALTISK